MLINPEIEIWSLHNSFWVATKNKDLFSWELDFLTILSHNQKLILTECLIIRGIDDNWCLLIENPLLYDNENLFFIFYLLLCSGVQTTADVSWAEI